MLPTHFSTQLLEIVRKHDGTTAVCKSPHFYCTFLQLEKLCSTHFKLLARIPRYPCGETYRPSIDIVIPFRGGIFVKDQPEMGLWMTILSCERALRNSDVDYRYYLVGNGKARSGFERDCLNRLLDGADKTGHLGKAFDFE